MSFMGTFVFQDVGLQGFNGLTQVQILFPDLLISAKGIGIAVPIGFALAVLMFMDQSICAALIHVRANKLKKGVYYHFDIILLAIITFVLSIMGLPWINGALPHTPMHFQSISETEPTSERRVIRAVESRLATFLAHGCIAISYLMLPVPLQYIPEPVLYGLFIYMSVASLPGLDFWNRICLLFTETSVKPDKVEIEERFTGIDGEDVVNDEVAYSDSIFVNADFLDHHTEISDTHVHPYFKKTQL
eukprot:CAMPEP_0119050948 /NCGR_PEP_ID=MMETSP1177-20130426/72717_1 /TAXON_ID=2985 /ORGANISM="Ochromonas sp, Strain CCMP1899" /LENGTH=245 /DNA_ID=CAMNT_0007029977 /DNA_START=929 /DNA_END=1667 /DNA_ORIENTATION=+